MRRGGAVVFLSICLLIARLYGGAYDADLKVFVLGQTQALGIRTEIGEVGLLFPAGLSMKQVGLQLPLKNVPTPVPLYFDEVSVRLRATSLLLLRLFLTIDLKAYGGDIHAQTERFIFGNTMTSLVTIRDLQLEKYPLAALFQISGRLVGDLKAAGDMIDPLSNGKAQITITQLEYAGTYSAFGAIRIPQFQEGELATDVLREGPSIRIPRAQLTSSLGDASANAELNMANKNASGKFDIQLSDTGVTAFGGFLALAAHEDVQNPAAEWEGNFAAQEGMQPKVIIKSLRNAMRKARSAAQN